MKLWLISQNTNNEYDTYDSAVVAAETEDQARGIHPGGEYYQKMWEYDYSPWVKSPSQVFAKYIGEAAPGTQPGIICASFNAG